MRRLPGQISFKARVLGSFPRGYETGRRSVQGCVSALERGNDHDRDGVCFRGTSLAEARGGTGRVTNGPSPGGPGSYRQRTKAEGVAGGGGPAARAGVSRA